MPNKDNVVWQEFMDRPLRNIILRYILNYGTLGVEHILELVAEVCHTTPEGYPQREQLERYNMHIRTALRDIDEAEARSRANDEAYDKRWDVSNLQITEALLKLKKLKDKPE